MQKNQADCSWIWSNNNINHFKLSDSLTCGKDSAAFSTLLCPPQPEVLTKTSRSAPFFAMKTCFFVCCKIVSAFLPSSSRQSILWACSAPSPMYLESRYFQFCHFCRFCRSLSNLLSKYLPTYRAPPRVWRWTSAASPQCPQAVKPETRGKDTGSNHDHEKGSPNKRILSFFAWPSLLLQPHCPRKCTIWATFSLSHEISSFWIPSIYLKSGW